MDMTIWLTGWISQQQTYIFVNQLSALMNKDWTQGHSVVTNTQAHTTCTHNMHTQIEKHTHTPFSQIRHIGYSCTTWGVGQQQQPGAEPDVVNIRGSAQTKGVPGAWSPGEIFFPIYSSYLNVFSFRYLEVGGQRTTLKVFPSPKFSLTLEHYLPNELAWHGWNQMDSLVFKINKMQSYCATTWSQAASTIINQLEFWIEG